MALLKRASNEYFGLRVEMHRTQLGFLVCVKEWIDDAWVTTTRCRPKYYHGASKQFEHDLRQFEDEGIKFKLWMKS